MKTPFNTLIIRNPFVDELDRFEALAANCKKSGVTHLTYTEVEPSLWEIDDPNDPYLHWSVVHTSMFKIFVPDRLKGWVPEAYAKRQRSLIEQRAKVLKQHGLKGAAFMYDPIYWPESVFRAYPEFRGPRVDAPHSCVHPRYAPCVDHPEVLKMYQEAFHNLQDLSDGVLDLLILRSNDSGTGFCWTHLYNGPNGPERCKHISHEQRVSTFLKACRDGMDRAGEKKSRVYLGGGSVGGPTPARLALSLPENCGYYAHPSANLGGERILSGFLSLFSLFPVRWIGSPAEVLEQLSTAYQKKWTDMVLFTCPAIFGNDWEANPEVLKVIELFNRNPQVRLVDKMQIGKEAATELYGAAHANDMVEAWWNIYQAALVLSKSTIGIANLIFWGTLAQRWLTRPLVTFPERLTPEEKAHYQPYLFQANANHDSLDPLDQEPRRQFDGAKNLAYFNKNFDQAVGYYRNAAERVQAVVDGGGDRDGTLAKQLTSFQLLFCILKNIRNTINFQIEREVLEAKIGGRETFTHEESGELKLNKVFLDTLIRSEIDNSLQLADLLESAEGRECLYVSASVEGETPIMLGPEVPQALRRKVEIMLDHVVDVDEWIGYRN